VDKTVGRVAETTGSLTCAETLEAEGRPLGRTAQRSTYCVVAQPEGGWIVETGEVGQFLSVHRRMEEAVGSARELVRTHVPSHVLVCKKDGTLQTERTYR
jgi:hypothetical protein